MDFYDPNGRPVVTPLQMVKSLTWGKLREKALALPSTGILLVTRHDLRSLARRLGAKRAMAWRPYRELYRGEVALALSPFGAPNVVAVAEEISAFGVRKVLFFGYCGSIREDLKAGELLLPLVAVREEGTSYHYLPPGQEAVADEGMVELIEKRLQERGIPFRKGRIWSTDAIYRETAGKVERYSREGVLAVEMEVAALLSWGKTAGVRVAALLLVSDELSPSQWTPHFSSTSFLKAREKALGLVAEIAKDLATSMGK